MHDSVETKTWTQPEFAVPGGIRILRPVNLLLIFLGAFTGSILINGPAVLNGELLASTILAGLSAACIAGSGNVMNDLVDRDVDRINRSDRPIPSGVVTGAVAVWIAVVLGIVGVVLGGLVSIAHLVVALGTICLLGLYNLKLKRIVVVGNMTVGLLVVVSIAYGAIIVHSLQVPEGLRMSLLLEHLLRDGVLIAFGFAFLLTLAREMVKDISDVQGDGVNGILTLPVRAGIRLTAVGVRTILATVLVLCPLPFLMFSFSGFYLLMVLPVMVLLVQSLIRLSTEPLDASLISGYIKWAMAFGLASIGASAIWPV
jgi:geranylgeranylglycerol-phosphate geranylgeranyltransferase